MDQTTKLQKIVDQLLLSPFNKKLTLVSMSETLADTGRAVQLLAEVAETIKPRLLSDEEPFPKTNSQDELVAQITDYAACICYDVEGGVTFDKTAFAMELQQPNSPKLLNLLYQILVDLPAAKQKAYISRFKSPILIPNDIQQNAEVQTLLTQLRAAQSRFQAVYSENNTILQQQVTTKIDQLQTEKTQLITRQDKLVERIRQVKLQPVQDEAVALAKRRRESLSEIEQLKQQIQQQNDLRKAYIQRTQAIVNSARGTPAGIIEACQQENKRVKQELVNLPLEIQEKESLKELIVQDPGDEVVLQMEQELEMAKKDLLRLKELNNITGEQPDQQENQVIYLRQNLAKFKGKHQELSMRYEKTQSDSGQIDAKMRSMMSFQVTPETLDDLQEMPLLIFKDLVGKGKSMKPQVQKVSEERRYLQKEYAILTRTTEILTQICVNYGQDVTQDQKQMMSTQNIHEARTILAEVESSIKQKRAFVQPKMSELANLKRQQQQLENNLNQQRQKVKQMDASKQGGIYKLKMMLSKAEAECQQVVSEIFKYQKGDELLKHEIERVEKEKDVNQLKKEIVLEQNDIKSKLAELRVKQGDVKDNLPQLLEQKKMFGDMVKILRAKRDSVKKMREESKGGIDIITIK